MLRLWSGGFVVFLVAVALAGCRRAESEEPARAEALFAGICARCHGADGRGGVAPDGGVAPRNFTDPAFQRTRNDADIRRAIVKGRANGAMPAFGRTFTAAQIEALVKQVRAFGARGERP